MANRTSKPPRSPRAEPPLESILKSARELDCRERLLTARDAANLLRLSLSWLAKARMRGDGPPYVKIGRAMRYSGGALVQMDEISSATVDERPVAMRKPVSSDHEVGPGALQFFPIELGIIVNRNTSIYIMSNVVMRCLGTNIQIHGPFKLLTVSQITLKYIIGYPHPSPSYEPRSP